MKPYQRIQITIMQPNSKRDGEKEKEIHVKEEK